MMVRIYEIYSHKIWISFDIFFYCCFDLCFIKSKNYFTIEVHCILRTFFKAYFVCFFFHFIPFFAQDMRMSYKIVLFEEGFHQKWKKDSTKEIFRHAVHLIKLLLNISMIEFQQKDTAMSYWSVFFRIISQTQMP